MPLFKTGTTSIQKHVLAVLPALNLARVGFFVGKVLLRVDLATMLQLYFFSQNQNYESRFF
jgi:hypothetical protein